jgi:aminoglycoside phosphotransferase (APT) family kinase protein
LVSKIRRSAASLDASLARALDLVPPAMSAPRLCHGDLHPSNIILSDHGPVVVDWFDASRGDPIADVARTCLTLVGDGAAGPRHLPGSNERTLAALTEAYLARVSGPLGVDDRSLARWQAIEAVARIAEGVPRDTLLEIWRRFDRAEQRSAAYAAAN